MKLFDFCVIQMTGSGNFPSSHTKPDFVLNLLYTTEAVFGLEQFEKGALFMTLCRAVVAVGRFLREIQLALVL